jgi:hypothetical protein
MRRVVVLSLVAAVAALATVSPAAAQSRGPFQAVCEAQGGTFTTTGTLIQLCTPAAGDAFSEQEMETQRLVCGRAQGMHFVVTSGVTGCLNV